VSSSESRPGPGNSVSLVVLLLATLLVAAVYGWLRWREVQGPPLPVLGEVSGFSLSDQDGREVSADSLRGLVWVADLIFTRCSGPCPKLTENFARLQREIAPRLPVRWVTLTADPEHDVPEVLKLYGARYGADFSRWHFLTGARTNINRVAMEELLLAVQEKSPEEREDDTDLYLHSTKWVLVDAEGRLRAVYEGTEPGSVRTVVRDIKRLLRERQP